MAYLFSCPDVELMRPADRPIKKEAHAATSAAFTALEWFIVALARRDPLTSVRPPSRFSIMMSRLFGGGHNPRLACPRLEALRTTAVLSWHHGFAVHSLDVSSFIAAGFTEAQYELLVTVTSRERAAAARSRRS